MNIDGIRVRLFLRVCIVAALLAAVGCSRKTQLSDEELAQVFHDAFLSNAYTSQKGIALDSLRLYEPIFQRYGYTTADVQYTIGSFSTRKSARLSDVVERAIEMLEQRGLELDKHIEVLNSLDEMATQRSTKVIYQDSLIEYRSLRDTSSVRIVVDGVRKGSYRVSFDYLVDSLDQTAQSYRSQSWAERDRLNPKNDSIEIVKSLDNSTLLKRNEIASFERTFKVNSEEDRLIVDIVSENEKEREEESKKRGKKGSEKGAKKRRSVTIKRFKIERTPDIEEAREMLFEELVNVRIFDDEVLFE